jgi:sugar-specific transcriptional regulator TrmB
MSTNIKKVLIENIGLTNGESDVYLALLELGLSSTGRITKEAGISSSKVYEVLQKLISKGLVSYVIENNIHYYSATPAERLINLLDEKQKEIEDGKSLIEEIVPVLENKRRQQKTPEAVIYRGRKGALIVLDEVIEAGKKGLEVVGFGTEDYPDYFPAQIKEYVKKAKTFKFKERLLFGEGFKSPNKNAKIRYLPKNFSMPVRTIVYGNKVALVDFKDPMTAIIIEKQSVADSYRDYFNALWKTAKS